MSYTLRGRLESRLAVARAAARRGLRCSRALSSDWWPLELAALMVGVGARARRLVYDRLLAYQPGWLAVPLGAARARPASMVLASRSRVDAPLGWRVALFAGAWLLAQVLGHAVFPLLRG